MADMGYIKGTKGDNAMATVTQNSQYLAGLAEQIETAVLLADKLEQADAVDTVVRTIVGDFLEDDRNHDFVKTEGLKAEMEEYLEDNLPDMDEYVKGSDIADLVKSEVEEYLPDMDEYVRGDEINEAVNWKEAIRKHNLVDRDYLDGFVREDELEERVEELENNLATRLQNYSDQETAKLVARLEAFEQRGFLGRLKWLLLGR
jgi:hypothetical protein